jgi:hypothetical protein
LKLIAAIIVLSLVVASLLVAGCTTSTQNTTNTTTSGQTSQVKAFSEALLNNVKKNLGPNETMVSSKIVENGTDSMRVTYTVANTTPQGLINPNGTTATLTVNVKQFPTKENAAKFYDNVSFGYTVLNKNELGTSPLQPGIVDPYKEAMGRSATITNSSYKTESLSFVMGQGSIALQADEFVIWGQMSWKQT